MVTACPSHTPNGLSYHTGGVPDDTSAEMADAALNLYGPRLVLALVRGIGGEAARSDLDALSAPFRALVFRGGPIKSWLEQALFSDDFPNTTKPVDIEKRQFLEAVLR